MAASVPRVLTSFPGPVPPAAACPPAKTRYQKQTATTGNTVDEACNEGDRAEHDDCQQRVFRPVSTENFHSKAHPMACFAKADVSEPALIDAMIVITKIESMQ